ncbi:pyridoxal phosphate-dependent decarboxylase family protein [Streptomyces tendae]|uniref:pyridoxal phosphate-dependent decarboxylase family protein n=1 Tax=Streptomyces TaxID=1883 RepID=UPI001369ED89|nr:MULTISPECIES: aminotransferase class V-fold PLP-dependent enzyme [unclassified Streptomyces]MBQ0968645.1 aspartate aminotransferase family protein [Streptomyces sp. RK74B]MBQ1008682.1 aspartate aminotransferase family protein [Streptomyces sp. RK23]MZG15449.1 aminotransferase class V-fold PLP-dependent enzyme [Streptomyces sp. SID5914]
MNLGEREILAHAAGQAMDYLAGLPERHVGATAGADELMKLLGGPLPERPASPTETIDLLGRAAAEGGVVASSGPRYFGYVVGGTLPVAIAADWITTAWDQNSGIFDLGPAVATAEHIAAGWLIDLLGLPADTSVGFPTGCAMAHVTALAAARHHVLAAAGWDVERRGLQSAPPIHIVVGEQRHLTIDLALRYLGFGTDQVHVVPADGEGRLRVEELEHVLADCHGPTIVCAQMGDVNSGAIDPVGDISDIAHRHSAWVHVDGAFGLWAAASPALRHLVAGVERADSWATDAHKWLNVPYDCGLVFVAHPQAHQAAMLHTRADYLPAGVPGERDPIEWVPELSRRARSLPVWAALRTLGRTGVADIIDRCCANTRRFVTKLESLPQVQILNDAVLNQVLVRFGDDDTLTRKVITQLQTGGVCWFGATTWHGVLAMRISVTSWRTTESDVDRTVEEIGKTLARVRGTASAPPPPATGSA